MGYYHTAYEVYAFLFVLSTAGLPVALSMLISEDSARREKTYRIALRLFLGLGIAGSGALLCFARPIAVAMGNAGAAAALTAIAPSVLFACLSAAVRGYFQGLQDMRPTAFSHVMEAGGKLIFGVLLADRVMANGGDATRGAAAAALGISIGTGASALFLLVVKGIRTRREKGREITGAEKNGSSLPRAKSVLRPLLHIAVPITISSGVMTLTRLLDMVLILRRLQGVGMSAEAVNTLYGAYSTLALPLYSLLPMLISSVALPLVPGIAGAREHGDSAGEAAVVRSAFVLTLVLGIPAAIGLSVFAFPILSLLFWGQTEAIKIGAPLLSLLGVSTLGACLVTVTASMLQAYRRPRIPILAMLWGGGVKLISAFILLGIPSIGMYGAPVSTFLCNTVIVLTHLAFLRPMLPDGIRLSGFCTKVVGASCLSVGGAWTLYRALLAYTALPPRAAVVPAVLACLLLYAALGCLTGFWHDTGIWRVKEKRA